MAIRNGELNYGLELDLVVHVKSTLLDIPEYKFKVAKWIEFITFIILILHLENFM